MDFSPDFLARYEIQRKLGAGGMGEVFLARERALDRLVAIKTVLSTAFDSDAARVRFQREAKLTGALSHPNIIRVLDHGEDAGRLYIAFEFVEGGDLGKLLRSRGPSKPDAFFAMAIPILDAVACAHEAGVLHRDLKADNVFLDADGQPRVADFGLAKGGEDAGMRTATGMLMGTPRYMAPEICRGERATAAADQYALGVLLYELIGGLPPFDSPQPLALLRMQVDDPVPPLTRYRPDVPAEVESLVMRALAKDLAMRWRSVGEMRDTLREIQARGIPWVARAEAAAPQTMMGVEPAATPQPGPATAPRVRRGTGRMEVLAPPVVPPGGATVSDTPVTPTMTPAPAASGPVSRNTGRIRRPAITSVVVAPPPSRAPWVAAAVVALLAVGGLAAWALKPGGPKPDPRYAALRFHLDRHRRDAMLYWDRELPARSVTVSRAGAADASATSTAAVPLKDTGQAALALRIELVDPAGFVHTLAPPEFPAVTLRSVVDELVRIRKGTPARPDDDPKLEPEHRVTDRFTKAFNTAFGRTPTVNDRYESPPTDVLATARESSGLDATLRWYANEGLEQTLEQAAALMSGADWKLKARVMSEVHHIAGLEAFCIAATMKVPTPALRFMYGMAPGGLRTAARPRILEGTSDFSRASWYTRALSEGDAKQAHESLERGLKRPSPADVRAVRYQDAITVLMDRGHALEGLVQVGQNPRFIAREFSRRVPASVQGQGVDSAVPLDILLSPRQPPRHVELVVEVIDFCELVHFDIRFGPDLLVCNRMPPGFRAHTRKDDVAVSFSTILDWDAVAACKEKPTITAHCDPSDGQIAKPANNLFPWRGGMEHIGLIEQR